MIADIFQLPVTAIKTTQGPAYGAAILACTAITEQDIQTVCGKWIKTSDTYFPNKEQKAYYDRKFQTYQLLYPALKEVFPKLEN